MGIELESKRNLVIRTIEDVLNDLLKWRYHFPNEFTIKDRYCDEDGHQWTHKGFNKSAFFEWIEVFDKLYEELHEHVQKKGDSKDE